MISKDYVLGLYISVSRKDIWTSRLRVSYKFISDHNKALKGGNEKEKAALEDSVDELMYNASSEVS